MNEGELIDFRSLLNNGVLRFSNKEFHNAGLEFFSRKSLGSVHPGNRSYYKSHYFSNHQRVKNNFSFGIRVPSC
jgi:hypothetical protein